MKITGRREENPISTLDLDMAAQKLKEWQKTEGKEDPAEESSENPQAAESGYTHKEGPHLFGSGNPSSNWKQGQFNPEVPGRRVP